MGRENVQEAPHPVWDMSFTGRTKKQMAAELSGVGLEGKVLQWDCQVGRLGRGSLTDRKDYRTVAGSSPRGQRVPVSPKPLEQGPVLHPLRLRSDLRGAHTKALPPRMSCHSVGWNAPVGPFLVSLSPTSVSGCHPFLCTQDLAWALKSDTPGFRYLFCF